MFLCTTLILLYIKSDFLTINRIREIYSGMQIKGDEESGWSVYACNIYNLFTIFFYFYTIHHNDSKLRRITYFKFANNYWWFLFFLHIPAFSSLIVT